MNETKKTITVVLEIGNDFDDDTISTIECDDDLQNVIDNSNINDEIGGSITVTAYAEGDRLNVKPEHFSDRELAERGLPASAFALDTSTGAAIFLERGMMGYFPRPNVDPTQVDSLNRTMGVSKAQANAMHAGSMFGWHCPGADPKSHFNQED